MTILLLLPSAAWARKPNPPEPGPVVESRPADLVAVEALRSALREARFPEAAAHAQDLLARFPDSPFRREAEYGLRRAENQRAPDPDLVAVLLPATGTYAPPGASLKAAIELGARKAGGLRLAVHDTSGTGEGCVAAVEKAVIEEGASMVLGPLTREESMPCAAAAQALRVPMLSFSSSEEVAAAGDQVFRAFPSVGEQVGALLDETYGRREWHRYAILHPTNPFGENAARAFTAGVNQRGGSVVTVVGYDPAAKDFRGAARQLGRKDYKARAAEFAGIRARARDPSKATLPPLVDYDAIFVPDGYQRAALLAAALAFEEFPVGAFRPHREETTLSLLGLNAWNNEEWPRRGGDYVVDSIFIDAFDPRSAAPGVQAFVQAWHEATPGEPTVLEATGYDAVRLAAIALSAGGNDTAAALVEATLPDPAAGLTGFDVTRAAERTWCALTVSTQGIRPARADEAPPGSP
jgi:ABC-type branched-subunit amino acid transport system substrate-binding protein